MSREFRPTILMIKRHTVTNMRYFCKTVNVNSAKSYNGSGVFWLEHLAEHGEEHVVNDWVSEVFYDSDELKDFALSFSELFNIVKSDEWANKKAENGLDGGFDSEKTCGIDSDGNRHYVYRDDERFVTGELVHWMIGRCSVRDKDGNTFNISSDDERIKSGELFGVQWGKVTVKDKDGNTLSVAINDERYVGGELTHIRTGTVTVRDSEGNTFSVESDDERLLSGELTHVSAGSTVVKDKDGNTFRVSLDDERWLSGELVSVALGVQQARTNCQFCNRDISVNNKTNHESTCDSNPDHVKRTFDRASFAQSECRFCQKHVSVSQLSRHEAICEPKSKRVSNKYPRVNCKHCNKLVASHLVERHESACIDQQLLKRKVATTLS